MEISLSRSNKKFNFIAENADGAVVSMDANPAIGGEGKGFRPMEMLLAGLGGCSGIDIVNILNKQKEPLEDIKIKINATRRENEVPSVFESIKIHFVLSGALSEQKVERAVEMTFEKYCSVAKVLSCSSPIEYTFSIARDESTN